MGSEPEQNQPVARLDSAPLTWTFDWDTSPSHESWQLGTPYH
jgi:hypothetical protein